MIEHVANVGVLLREVLDDVPADWQLIVQVNAVVVKYLASTLIDFVLRVDSMQSINTVFEHLLVLCITQLLPVQVTEGLRQFHSAFFEFAKVIASPRLQHLVRALLYFKPGDYVRVLATRLPILYKECIC